MSTSSQVHVRHPGPGGFSPTQDPWPLRRAEASGLKLLRYLPVSLMATASVVVAPAVLAAALVHPRGVGRAIVSIALAAAISLVFTRFLAIAWSHRRSGSELVFSDLLLWGWARRYYAERRLLNVRKSCEAAAREHTVIRVELLEGLARLLAIRNPYTHGHCRRVARHAERIARTMRLTPGEVAKIRTAALIHDVGKVYTPPEIINKPTRLTEEEFARIRLHAAEGAEMLGARDRELAAIIRHHHERVDGSGYPDGLVGGEIPLGARIIAVADTFDAVTSHRPYRRARSQKEALRLLAAERGAQLDANAVDAFTAGYCPRRSLASIALGAAAAERLSAVLERGPTALSAGGAPVAQLLPVLGASGVLAAAPVLAGKGNAHITPYAPHPAVGVVGNERPAQGTGPVLAAYSLPGGERHSSTHNAVRRLTSRRAPRSPRANSGTAVAAGVAQPGGTVVVSSAPTSTAGAPSAYSPNSSPREERNAHTESPPQSPKSSRAEGKSPASTPPVTIPSVSTPTVSTPAVTIPSVKVPPVTVPPVSTPPVTVPPVTVPPVTVPPVKLP